MLSIGYAYTTVASINLPKTLTVIMMSTYFRTVLRVKLKQTVIEYWMHTHL